IATRHFTRLTARLCPPYRQHHAFRRAVVTKQYSARARRHFGAFAAAFAAAAAVLALSGGLAAAQTTVRIARQYGISYLPLTVMEERKLLEQHARQLGLEVKTEWIQFPGGPPAKGGT